MRKLPIALRSAHPLGFVAALFAATVAFVNPLRETAVADDWAYALMVRHLLGTGEHLAHAWVAANPIAQIEWGALFVRGLGFSHAALRGSTLVLAVVALGAFYLLCREHRLERRESAALTMLLLSSTLFLRLSFSFMTDVPFLALFLVAVLLYTMALQRNSLALALSGSLAAAAAILTRQFGVALLAGFLLAWLTRRERPRSWRLLAAATTLPCVAAAIQIFLGTVGANFTARRLLVDE
jgi:hypothetical protein